MIHFTTLPLGDLGRDVRYGARALARAPRFAIVALLTIVLMVAGVTTIFTLVNSVLLRPLPYPDSDRLVTVESVQPNAFGTFVAYGDVETFRDQARSFDLWGLYRLGYLESLPDASGEPLVVQDLGVTPDLFPMLGIDVALGRPLQPSDAEAGAADAVVISHELWQVFYGGDANVIGRTLPLRWGAFTVVGVAPPGANVPRNWLTYPIIWRPIRAGTDPEDGFTALARLRPDASLEAGRAELAALAAGLAAAQPDTHEERTTKVTALLDQIVGTFKRLLWIFFGAVSCVLLIGVGNLTILQLARNAEREREVAVRAALGAGRPRIMRERIVESMLLCGVGGALGLAAAWVAVRLVAAALPRGFPRVEQIGVDAAVALFACGVSLLVGIAVGVLPAWHASHPRLTRWLNEGGRSATVGTARSGTQRALVTVQTAVALVLLISAGLLANSFYRLLSRDAGMQEEGLWVARTTLPSSYSTDARQNEFWTLALEQVRAVAGVESAAIVVNSAGPLTGSDISTSGIVPEGAVAETPRDGLRASYRRVSDGYFAALGTPLSRGRPILASDVAGTESVVVINELAAETLWPGEDPLGKRLRARDELKTVVGVIPTFRHTTLDGELAAQLYFPYLQERDIAKTTAILFRTAPGDRRTPAAVRSALTGLEAELELTVTTLADARWRLVQPERFRTTVLLAMAGSAVFLALVGIIGVVAYTVGQRRREIAVRVALGAVRRDILRLASRQAIMPALFGLAFGVAGALLTTRLLSVFLVDVRTLDLPTFAAALAVLALAVVAAAVMTARQALVIDPVEALRSE